METLVEKLDRKLREWNPDTAAAVRSYLGEIIEMADNYVLDLFRARIREQEVLDLIDDESPSGGQVLQQ